MGVYINPSDETKEEFLSREGQVVVDPQWPPRKDHTFVCLINNPEFSAAAVIVNQSEFNRFNDPNDPRPKVWYSIPTDCLAAVVN